MPPKTSKLDRLLYGDQIVQHEAEHHSPPTATLLVSLFLILITFFLILNKNATPDPVKRKVVWDSVVEKFGKPTDDLQAFGGIVAPRTQDYSLELQRLLGENAVVETTINGDRTKITFAKDLFFYADETDLREDKIALIKKIANTLRNIRGGKEFGLGIVGGLQNYEMDKEKLSALKHAFGIENTSIGLSTNYGGQFVLVISDE